MDDEDYYILHGKTVTIEIDTFHLLTLIEAMKGSQIHLMSYANKALFAHLNTKLKEIE